MMNPAAIVPRRLVPRRPQRGLFLALLLCGLLGCSEAPPRTLAAGDRFPLGELRQTRPLGSDQPPLAGRTLLINFWATWCAPCRREMPELQRLSDRLDPARFGVVGISVDRDAHLAREFALAHGIRFHIRQDREQRLATTTLGIAAFPVTFVVAPDGIVLERIDGILESPPASLGPVVGGERTAVLPNRRGG